MKQIFYVPERGDIVLVSLSPPGHKGSTDPRPAVVLTPQAYNARVGWALLCPVTPRIKGYPFEVLLPPGLSVRGAILADQVESVDWRAHRAEPVGTLPPPVIEEVLGKVRVLLA
jgi:mRNA interferase MazF